MMTLTRHRLDGLEPDNMLGFLALLGCLRALDAVDRELPQGEQYRARADWDVDSAPLRPALTVRRAASQEDIARAVDRGISTLAAAHDFGGAADLAFSREECRDLLKEVAVSASASDRYRADLFAALMSDGALKKDPKSDAVQPTYLCFQFGQGHQHFLERLSNVPSATEPLTRGRGRSRVTVEPAEIIAEALFSDWQRIDPTASFRWDPEEDVRYALMAGDPTDSAYKKGTQHGANRLAAVGLSALTVVPSGSTRYPLSVLGGDSSGGFSFAWPIWRGPASLAAIRALLSHPDLRNPERLTHIGITEVYVARRISVGKFMNVARARPVDIAAQPRAGT